MAAIGAMVKNKFVILCVDDEENPLVLRKFLLQKAGYEVITAKSGLEALKIASSEAIDLVLFRSPDAWYHGHGTRSTDEAGTSKAPSGVAFWYE